MYGDYAGAYSPYYGYPAYGYAGYGWGYPGYAAWWGSNKGGKMFKMFHFTSPDN
ncbi:hypothetical protein PRIPAC_93287, partial [Pristionchus pacificus]|uniref:Uncharacterized protein n=1 Tax=Pristionchus pacificus TaxID=54126 RepID=A0A2A6BBP3_PRIPA